GRSGASGTGADAEYAGGAESPRGVSRATAQRLRSLAGRSELSIGRRIRYADGPEHGANRPAGPRGTPGPWRDCAQIADRAQPGLAAVGRVVLQRPPGLSPRPLAPVTGARARGPQTLNSTCRT